jgi:hypothetical protein
MYLRPFILLGICILCGPVEAGSVVVTVKDSKGALVSNAVVYAKSNSPVASREKKQAVIDQRDKQFVPYVTAVQVGTSVIFPNTDNIRHEVYSFSPAKKFELPLYAGVPAAYYNLVGAAISVPLTIATGLGAWRWQLQGAALKGNLRLHLIGALTSASLIFLLCWMRSRLRAKGSSPGLAYFALTFAGAGDYYAHRASRRVSERCRDAVSWIIAIHARASETSANCQDKKDQPDPSF